MAMETSATLMIIAFCWIMLVVADLVVSGVVRLTAKVQFKKVFLWGLLSLAVPPAVIGYGILVERNRFEIKEVEIEFDNLPKSFDGYRIVHLSDLHARSFSKRTDKIEKAVRKINSLKPDLIAFTGDLITLTPDEIDCIASSLEALEASDGVISVLGNHDYGTYADTSGTLLQGLIDREAALGWDLLLNEHKVLRRDVDTIVVVGVENTSSSHFFPSNGDLNKAAAGTEEAFRGAIAAHMKHGTTSIFPTLSSSTIPSSLSLLYSPF